MASRQAVDVCVPASVATFYSAAPALSSEKLSLF